MRERVTRFERRSRLPISVVRRPRTVAARSSRLWEGLYHSQQPTQVPVPLRYIVQYTSLRVDHFFSRCLALIRWRDYGTVTVTVTVTATVTACSYCCLIGGLFLSPFVGQWGKEVGIVAYAPAIHYPILFHLHLLTSHLLYPPLAKSAENV